jgi:predicted nucleic acid-binding protein
VILVDTSVWVDHLRADEPVLAELLHRGRVLGHPWVTAEVALGGLPPHHQIIRLMSRLPQATVATHVEVMALIERRALSGIGYVDAQLLAATMLSSDATLWTRDRRLREVAVRTGYATDPSNVL